MEDRIGLTNLIEGYRVSGLAEGLTAKHLDMVRSVVLRFAAYLESERQSTHVTDIGPDQLRGFLAHLRTVPRYQEHNLVKTLEGCLSRTTINGYARALSSFWTWLEREDLIQSNPFKSGKVTIPRPDSKEVQIFSDDQMRALLQAIDTKTRTGSRDHAMISLMADAGLRDAEVRNLKLDDVDLKEMTARVRGKGHKERVVPIGSRTTKALWRYVNLYRPKPATAKITNLFLSRQGQSLAPDRLRMQIKVHARAAGITGVRASSHTLRHTFATSYLRNGADAFSLQRMLGHSDLSMVKRYVHIALGDLKTKHRQYSPLDNLDF